MSLLSISYGNSYFNRSVGFMNNMEIYKYRIGVKGKVEDILRGV